jgi:NAD(P)-dependent dehydrogenase (short-subunit alcohol dehydrogenase family)
MRKVALITGGARGIGYGISAKLAGEGWGLMLAGRRSEKDVADVLEKLRVGGGDIAYFQGDMGNSSARRDLIDATIARFGHLNALVNNAGVAPKERLDMLEATEESFEWVMGINLQGPYFLTQLAARRMIELREEDATAQCAIINVSSISATIASVNRGEYCVSKAGVAMATKLWAARLGEFDIPVYEIRPGVTKTDMTTGVSDKYERLIMEEGLCVQKRWGMPEDTGKAVAMLLRGDLAYSTGQVIMIDGGLTIDRL